MAVGSLDTDEAISLYSLKAKGRGLTPRAADWRSAPSIPASLARVGAGQRPGLPRPAPAADA